MPATHTAATIAAARLAFEVDGLPLSQISRASGVSPCTLARWRDAYAWTQAPRPLPAPPAWVALAGPRYAAGEPVGTIAAAVGISRQRLAQVAAQRGWTREGLAAEVWMRRSVPLPNSAGLFQALTDGTAIRCVPSTPSLQLIGGLPIGASDGARYVVTDNPKQPGYVCAAINLPLRGLGLLEWVRAYAQDPAAALRPGSWR